MRRAKNHFGDSAAMSTGKYAAGRARLRQAEDAGEIGPAGYAPFGMKSEARFIYVVGWSEAGPVKIGVAADVRRRLHGIQNGCPYPLRALRSWDLGAVVYDLEISVHRSLKAASMCGEWFNIGLSEAAEAVERAAADLPAGWIGKGRDELLRITLAEYQRDNPPPPRRRRKP